jgi:hypothetical protein
MNVACLFAALALTALAAGPRVQSSQPARPNYTGTWKANFAKSKLQIPAPENTLFVIEHREPHFKLSRTHAAGEYRDTWSIALTTDGKEVTREEANRTVRCRLTWEGNSLVFAARIRMPNGEVITDRVKYVMAADGKSFTAYESYRGRTARADNVWVLERQEQR